MTLALVVGTLLAVSALAFVLYPIFFSDPRAVRAARAGSRDPRASKADMRAALDDSTSQESAVAALREIEFDHATGKLSETDYASLKAQYTRQAILAMRHRVAGLAHSEAPDEPDDEIEAAVRAYRAQHATCPTCGPRPESDAVYCSNCGRYLHDRCADCGAPVVAHDARYCERCGNRLAA
ncbi:MAG: zinc ribbon domain-containing protein [Gemmatimonadales bacterium]